MADTAHDMISFPNNRLVGSAAGAALLIEHQYEASVSMDRVWSTVSSGKLSISVLYWIGIYQFLFQDWQMFF
ncbi:hypothetical protein M3201_11845 [Paenibacillus motobuensis]|uniref:hypothetical protein n=1 Tax=Paenibacillus TaxID=44249 RepID=UPI00203B7E90|nr:MULTISPECIES: hypothetical protein [Paenibacillus]MCM3040392.1 hypothetical protein [Paenibacillus lutimineralis]MCM3647496.1 hypothetical protein [Paenibacillus motobuensis]